MKDATVVMTRDNDRFVTLQGRADLANHKHADIFISIHANSVDRKSPMFTKINGASVYTLGLKRSDTNLSVAMRENAVLNSGRLRPHIGRELHSLRDDATLKPRPKHRTRGSRAEPIGENRRA